jgi:hypothetical protein
MALTVGGRNEFRKNSNDCFGDPYHGGNVHLDDMIQNIVDQLVDRPTRCCIINKEEFYINHATKGGLQ